MSTSVSPNIIKSALLLVNSLVFIIGCFVLIDGYIEVINWRTNQFEYNLEEESEKLELIEDTISTNFTAFIEDRFPSTGAPSVLVIFGVISIIESVLGIMALNKEDIRLLRALSITLVIGLFIRSVFFLATICMYAFTIDHNPIRATTICSAVIAVMELLLIPSVCHFAKIVKRGHPQQLQQQQQQEVD